MKMHHTRRVLNNSIVMACMLLSITIVIGQGPTSTDIQSRFYAIDEFSSVDLSGNEIIYRDARYIGGMKALRQHMKDNVVLPANYNKSDNLGKVLIRCTIGSDGSVTNATVVRSVDLELDSAVLNAILTTPLWQPAIQYGRAVASTLIIPYKIK